MKVIVDTSAWFAYFDKDDENHKAAKRFLETRPILVIPETVFYETIDLMQRRLSYSFAIKIGEYLRDSSLVKIVKLDENLSKAAWDKFKKARSHKISLVDCTVFVTAEDLGVKRIFAFDKHFKKKGFQLVP